ncbi:hypothetical protein ACFY9N_05130 [Microbacterium sp. NPDC008134]|uniref:hypothetical protein n=1 Tax=Microbacterium sp. NPDC008134 TaxID=3364183 RepID=UPI0036F0BCA0
MSDHRATDQHAGARRRSKRVWGWVIAAAAVVLLVVAGLIIWQSSSRSDSAENAAEAYLRALESGERSAVEATGIVVSDEALLAFDSAESLVSDATVTSVDETGSQATARVSFVLGDAAHEAVLTLARSDGRWIPDDSGLAAVTVSQTVGTAVSIGEAVFETSEPLSLLPAAYTVAVAPAAYLSGSIGVVALPGATDETAIEASFRPDATDAVQQRLDELLQECEAETALPSDGCGVRIPWGTELRAVDDVAFRIETLPTVVLADDGTSFTASGGELVATLTGTAHDGTERTTTYRSENWAVHGEVSFAGNETTLTVW